MNSLQDDDDGEGEDDSEEEEEEESEMEVEDDGSDALQPAAEEVPSIAQDTLSVTPPEAGPSTSRLPEHHHEEISQPRQFEGSVLSPISRSRPLSRSPPASRHHSPAATSSRSHSHSRSRSQSPSSLIERTAALSVSTHDTVRERAATEAAKLRAKQHRKYHSKRGAQRIGGRQKGSKAKMDTRVKPDKGGFWD